MANDGLVLVVMMAKAYNTPSFNEHVTTQRCHTGYDSSTGQVIP
jgi:hypothetical protein